MEPEAAGGASPDPTMPRWVKGFILVALLVAAGFVVLHLSGAGPTRH